MISDEEYELRNCSLYKETARLNQTPWSTQHLLIFLWTPLSENIQRQKNFNWSKYWSRQTNHFKIQIYLLSS
jgi:hypothetical protein